MTIEARLKKLRRVMEKAAAELQKAERLHVISTEDRAQLVIKAFASSVRSRREQLGITQTELARRIGFTRASISNLEAGRQDIPIRTAVKIATALGRRLQMDLA